MNGAPSSMSSRSRKRRERDNRVKRLGYEELQSLKQETEELGQELSQTTERQLKTSKRLEKEQAKHAETKSDAFFGARMARYAREQRDHTAGVRMHDTRQSALGVEVVVVVRSAIDAPLLEGLVSEVPHDKTFYPMPTDLKEAAKHGIDKYNTRQEMVGNARQTKGVKPSLTHPVSHGHVLGDSFWNKLLLHIREVFVNTGHTYVRLKPYTRGGNVVRACMHMFVLTCSMCPASSHPSGRRGARQHLFHSSAREL